MILTDLHSHTYPSSHDAKSTLREMAENACKRGLGYFGVSNHFDYDYDFSRLFHAEKQRLMNGSEDDYFREGRELQEEYRDRMRLLIGAEFGYSEDISVSKKYAATYEKYKPDFIINSVHGSGGSDFCRMELPNDKRALFGRYLTLIRHSLDAPYHYDIVGHIEYIVRYVPFEERAIEVSEFGEQIEDILQTVIDKNKILEVNSSTYSLPRICLPNADILKVYYGLGGREISFGSDAHSIERIADKREAVTELLASIGFKYITVPIRGEYIRIKI